MQDSADDDSYAGTANQDQSEGGEPRREDSQEDDVVDEIPKVEHEYFDPQDYNGRKRDLAGRRMPFMNSTPANIPGEGENLPLPQEEPVSYPGSRGQAARPCGGDFVSHDERYERVMDIFL